MRWGENKFVQLYVQHLGVEPQICDALLFFNSKRDCSLLRTQCGTGGEEDSRRLSQWPAMR
jgi:hypothetical protein